MFVLFIVYSYNCIKVVFIAGAKGASNILEKLFFFKYEMLVATVASFQ